MPTTDITVLNYLELSELRTRIDDRMTEMRDTGVDQLRLKFVEDAAALGLTVEDIVGTRKKRRRRKSKRKQDDLLIAGQQQPDAQ